MLAKTLENQTFGTSKRPAVALGVDLRSARFTVCSNGIEYAKPRSDYPRPTLFIEFTETFSFPSAAGILIIFDKVMTPVPARRENAECGITDEARYLPRRSWSRTARQQSFPRSSKRMSDFTGQHTSREPSDTFAFAAVDPRVRYPSYKSLDEFIDVDRLRSLDGYVRRQVERYSQAMDERKFYTGPYRLDGTSAELPGSRMIYLACSEHPDSYFDLDRTDLWKLSNAANDFSLLMDFIAELPFEATGRMLVMYDDKPRAVPAHRDHVETDVLHEFIWFRTNLSKPFYMLNHESGEKLGVSSHSAWFDTVNQFHGADPADGLTFSIRVDGRFTDDFRSKIPKPAFNAASTPSYWASSDEQGVG